VTLLAVANKVDDNVLLELGTPISGNLANEIDGFYVITVNMEDGSVDKLRNVGTVCLRSKIRLFIVSCDSYYVSHFAAFFIVVRV